MDILNDINLQKCKPHQLVSTKINNNILEGNIFQKKGLPGIKIEQVQFVSGDNVYFYINYEINTQYSLYYVCDDITYGKVILKPNTYDYYIKIKHNSTIDVYFICNNPSLNETFKIKKLCITDTINCIQINEKLVDDKPKDDKPKDDKPKDDKPIDDKPIDDKLNSQTNEKINIMNEEIVILDEEKTKLIDTINGKKKELRKISDDIFEKQRLIEEKNVILNNVIKQIEIYNDKLYVQTNLLHKYTYNNIYTTTLKQIKAEHIAQFKKLKILIISTQYPSYGGAATNAYNLVEFLKKKGITAAGLFLDNYAYSNKLDIDINKLGGIFLTNMLLYDKYFTNYRVRSVKLQTYIQTKANIIKY